MIEDSRIQVEVTPIWRDSIVQNQILSKYRNREIEKNKILTRIDHSLVTTSVEQLRMRVKFYFSESQC